MNSSHNTKKSVQAFDTSDVVVDSQVHKAQNEPKISISNIECLSQNQKNPACYNNSKVDGKFDLNKFTRSSTKVSEMGDINVLNKLQSSMEKTQLSRYMFAQAIREEKLRRLAMNNQDKKHLQSSMEKTQRSRYMFTQAIREEKLKRLAMNNQDKKHSTYL